MPTPTHAQRLCRFLNVIKPGTVKKIETSSMVSSLTRRKPLAIRGVCVFIYLEKHWKSKTRQQSHTP